MQKGGDVHSFSFKKKSGLIAFSIVFVLLLGYAAFAVMANDTLRSKTLGGNTTTIFVNEDSALRYIFTLNNTDTGIGANITAVLFNLPGSFTFVVNSNESNYTVDSEGGSGSTTVNYSFKFNYTSTTGPLNFSNWSDALIQNSTLKYFAFNLTAADPGTYFINASVFNRTSNVTTVNQTVTVIVNDTTKPSSVAFGGDTQATGSVLTRNNFFVRVNFSDNGVVGAAKIEIFNATSGYTLVNASFTTSNASSYGVNFTGLADGYYYINATVNDTFNNFNSTTNLTTTLNITVDVTAPSITFSCTPTNTIVVGDLLTCTCSSTDATTGVSSTTYTIHPSTSDPGTRSTTCTSSDVAGNTATSTVSYEVENSGSSGGSGGGSSSSSSTSWRNTFTHDGSELSAQGTVSQSMSSKERARIKIGGATHTVGVVSITTGSAVIEIASTPQQATFNVGETKKYDLTNDGYYDLSVTLVSITNGKANVSMQAIHDAVPAGAAASDSSGTSGTPATGTDGSSAMGSLGSSSMTWWIVGLVVLVVVVVFFLMKRRN